MYTVRPRLEIARPGQRMSGPVSPVLVDTSWETWENSDGSMVPSPSQSKLEMEKLEWMEKSPDAMSSFPDENVPTFVD